MPYVFLDDGFHSNPKILDAGLDGSGLYARALSFCGHYLTDGYVSRASMLQLAEQKPKLVRKCVDAGLFVADGNRYWIPDYLAQNPSREQVEARRAQKREAGRRSAAVRAGAATPVGTPVEQPLEQNGNETPTRAGAQTRPAPAPSLSTTAAEQSSYVVEMPAAALPNESLEELGQRLEATQRSKPFCRGGQGTCDDCVGSCGIEEVEAEAPVIRVHGYPWHDSPDRAPYGSVDSVYEVIDKPAGNTRRELEKWLPQLTPHQVEHVREQVLACEPRKSKAAYAVGTAQRLARAKGAA